MFAATTEAFQYEVFPYPIRQKLSVRTEALSLHDVAYGSLFNCNQPNSRHYPNSRPPVKLTPGYYALIVNNRVASRCLLVMRPKCNQPAPLPACVRRHGYRASAERNIDKANMIPARTMNRQEAIDHHDSVPENRLQRLPLTGGKPLACPPFAPRNRLLEINRWVR